VLPSASTLEPALIKGDQMNIIVDRCIVPLGVGVSLSTYIAAPEGAE
jgi:hypothetical protein